jgi:hypothetical protein
MALETPFYDQVNYSTYRIPSALAHIRGAEQVMIRHRTLLRQARRFVIEDSMVDLVARASLQTRRLPIWIRLARLPFDKVWVEYDQLAKLAALERAERIDGGLNPEGVSRECGMLMVRDTAHEARWVAFEFGMVDGEALPAPVAYVIDPEGTAVTTAFDGALGMPRLSAEVPGMQEGIEYATMGMIDQEIGGRSVAVAPWFKDRVGAVLEPLHRLAIADAKKTKGEAVVRRWAEVLTAHVMEFRGTARFLLTLMATINEEPILEYRDVAARPGGRSARGRMVPFLGHRTVALKAPKTRAIPWLTKRLTETYGKKRRHEVSGHWRTMATTEGTKRIWIESYHRGDASLGYVTHDYVVRKGTD